MITAIEARKITDASAHAIEITEAVAIQLAEIERLIMLKGQDGGDYIIYWHLQPDVWNLINTLTNLGYKVARSPHEHIITIYW